MEPDEINIKGLKALQQAFKKTPTTRVGIMGGKVGRKEAGGPTNAEVGAAHEFGTTKLPQRSFLRIPISEQIQRYLERSGAFDKEAIARVIRERSIRNYVEKIGITAVRVVLDAFDSGGFGKWKPSNMARKTVHQTLVETRQLRDSITEEVKE